MTNCAIYLIFCSMLAAPMPATRPQVTTMVDTPHKKTDSHSHSHSRFDLVWTTIAVDIVLFVGGGSTK